MSGPRDVHINVHLDSVKPLRFSVQPVSKGLPKGPEDEIIFRNEGHDGFNIHFDLKDPIEGYVFPEREDLHEAVWSKLGKQCPTSAASDVFTPLRVENNRKTLVVYNKNPCPKQGRFCYTLRVTNDDGKTYLDLDPGGDNQNGESRFNTSFALAFAGGALVGCLATLGTQALLEG